MKTKRFFARIAIVAALFACGCMGEMEGMVLSNVNDAGLTSDQEEIARLHEKLDAMRKETSRLQQNLVEMSAMVVEENLGKQWNCELQREADKASLFCYNAATANPSDGGAPSYKHSFNCDLNRSGFSTLLNVSLVPEMLDGEGRMFRVFDHPPKPAKKAKPKPFTFPLPTK